ADQIARHRAGGAAERARDDGDRYAKPLAHRVSYPPTQTARATSTKRASLASWSRSVSGLPTIELEKPHCGLHTGIIAGAGSAFWSAPAWSPIPAPWRGPFPPVC